MSTVEYNSDDNTKFTHIYFLIFLIKMWVSLLWHCYTL